MKIVHISDLHLKKFYNGDLPIEITKELIEDVWKSFYEVSKYINKISADIVLIAGDVYEREFFNMSDMNRFLEIIKSIDAKVFISCGNHDYLDDDSLWNRVELPKNLYVFTNEFSYVDLEDLGARIFGISYDSFKFNKILEEPQLSHEHKNILVIHSDLKDDRYLPLSKDFLNKFSYVALGHIHKRQKVMDRVFYSGSIEPHSFKDTGDRGIIIYDTDKDEIGFKDFSSKDFVTLEYEISKDDSLQEILREVQKLLDDGNLYRIKLKGKHKNHSQISEFLNSNLDAYYFEIIDEVKNDLDIYEVFRDDYLVKNFLESFDDTESLAKNLAIEYLLEQYNGI